MMLLSRSFRSLTVGGLAVSLAVAAAALPAKGKPIPAWSGKTVGGKALASADLKGKVVLLNFFNNYCSTCREEYPHLVEMQKKLAAKGFTIVSVSNDETAEEAGTFAKETKATFPVLHDPKNVIYEKLKVTAVPANVLVDRKGTVVAVFEGLEIPKGLNALKAAVEKAVAAR